MPTTTKGNVTNSIWGWLLPILISLCVTALTAFLTLGGTFEKINQNSKAIEQLQQTSVSKEQFTETKENVREIKTDVKDIQKDIKDILKQKGDNR